MTARQISDLIAWARPISDAGVGTTDATELAAYHAAKNDLITLITSQNNTRRPTDDR